MVCRSQHDMLAHVKGWKHNYLYLKKAHPDRVHWEEEDAIKDPAVRKMIKDSLAEVEQLEGRGQVKVLMKEPFKVAAFKGLHSAQPKPLPMSGTGMGPNGPTFGSMFSDQSRHEEFPRNDDGPYNDFSDEYRDEFEPPNFKRFASNRRFSDSNSDKYQDDYESSNFGRFSPKEHFSDPEMSPRPYPRGSGDDFSPNNGRDRFGSGRMFPDQFRGPQMRTSLLDIPVKKPFDRPRAMKAPSDSGCDSDSLLHYLETFRIENESDAQLVLKVTQKLTELLMEYRLKTIAPEGRSPSSSMNSSFLSSSSSSLPRSNDRYSRALPKGQSRFLDGALRF
ncbi:uncharacterized protein si:ch211-197h24.6 isoform X2 [Syngnathoides biaculeatus]|nr:uncharacterized protein si:ch211-197h24.6 isoform X2 [Syngnathoides biaculeatus]XP_061675194.1 uncharacterized protein si:ch211-197h24.6 isoform X2 [Syngnathoides biaculeatus]XP_061675195.1 uncharacterized protein si:ch211-197h24.6 isoform X2 [Syngnathoides biaculeatus]XP_061675196.1 uncharacterized protein si:ch211-197h24.6 isoform X2 [Syngnathoides biaculeatus]